MPIIPQKLCRKCGESKPLTDFNKDRQKADGLCVYCRSCAHARGRAYYQQNRQQVIERTNAYQRARPEANRQKSARYRQRHRTRYLAANRAYAAAWRAKHRDQDRANARGWFARNRDHAIALLHIRRALQRARPGKFTAQEWQAVKAAHQYRCVRCGRAEPDIKLTVDHIVSLSCGGSNDISNIQPLCWPCNRAKGVRGATDYR